MGSHVRSGMNKLHVVCIPFPTQGHINAMLSVAKLFHEKGFHITFVNTEYNHRRIINSRGPNALDNLPDFHFKTIPDGIPVASDAIDAPQDIPTLCTATSENLLAPFCSLLAQLNDDTSSNIPCVSCIISDGLVSCTIEAAAEFNIPVIHFFPFSACSLLGFISLSELRKRKIISFKDESFSTKEEVETKIDWISGMKNIGLKDLPSFPTTIDPNGIIRNFIIQETVRARKASAIILNTFNALEQQVLEDLSHTLPPIYTIGPVHLLTNQIKINQTIEAIATNVWEENPNCISWLNSREPTSVLYVNFGSVIKISHQHFLEFAWGLANSGKPFLWIIRSDLVQHDLSSTCLPFEFFGEIEGRGMIASWCAQKEVLKHPSIAAFLTHCGWNSIIESIAAGIPMILWPFFADQPINCRYCCIEWGVGLEIHGDVKKDEVERCTKEVMEGKKGKDMKKKVMELKSLAEESCDLVGSSHCNLDKLIVQILGNNLIDNQE